MWNTADRPQVPSAAANLSPQEFVRRTEIVSTVTGDQISCILNPCDIEGGASRPDEIATKYWAQKFKKMH